MSNLTERLRRGFGGLVPPICDEAANKIETLRTEYSDLKAAANRLQNEVHGVLQWIDIDRTGVTNVRCLEGAAKGVRELVSGRRGEDDG